LCRHHALRPLRTENQSAWPDTPKTRVGSDDDNLQNTVKKLATHRHISECFHGFAYIVELLSCGLRTRKWRATGYSARNQLIRCIAQSEDGTRGLRSIPFIPPFTAVITSSSRHNTSPSENSSAREPCSHSNVTQNPSLHAKGYSQQLCLCKRTRSSHGRFK
jgi:hypothetical protein